MKQAKKKNKSRVSRKGNTENHAQTADQKEQRALKNLLEVFVTLSVEEVSSAYREAKGDESKAAEILVKVEAMEDLSTTCSSSSGNYDVGSSSSSNASDVFGYEFKQKNKSKKVVASAGTVSAMLGKDYVRSVSKKGSSKLKGFHEESWSKEEAEQFLCSMLGDDCELSLALVSDVLCQCGYNIDNALDALLELSASSKEQGSGYFDCTRREDAQYLRESNDRLIDRISDSNFWSSDVELQDNVWFTRNRNPSKISESTESHPSTETGNMESELPHKVLESLFNMPSPKSTEHQSNTMNWKNVVKKLTSLGQRLEPDNNGKGQLSHANGDEYHVLRGAAQQHWDSMKLYYQKASTAYTTGEKEYASFLSEQGRLKSKMAREADEKASQNIFTARNKSIENMITIDLHGQHIKQGMKLLKLHLLFGAFVQSVRSFRVITGCGSHGVGRSKLKNSVINLLKKEGIAYSEENSGTLLIRLDGQTDFSFLDTGSDSDE
ncbi:hypothetical protein ACP275_14G073300 [Erythranthe tilingii]